MRLLLISLIGSGLLAMWPRTPSTFGQDLVAKTGPLSPQEEQKKFHLPAGFEIQLVAAEPYVRKPININFDDRGRLWVTESVEYPFPAKEGAAHRDAIRILEDLNGDGLADEVTTFADGLNIPIGVLPITKGAIAHSIPNIYRFLDRDGDDRADSKEPVFGSYGFQDTHGMTGEFTWGFDGWVYACHGFANHSEVRKLGTPTNAEPPLKMHSGNTYRFKPDGSKLEQFTFGQVNPFGLTFDPLGNLYSCDCHSKPIYMLLRGAHYPTFGKPDDDFGLGPEMINHDHGSTAIAGIAYYAADHFPPEYRDMIFVGNVATNRINCDKLERHGSTLKAIEQPDFLKCDDPWFRPVDIKLGPDGALYVADFYNRIIGHYEVDLHHPGRDRQRGRIWRIIYRGPEASSPARSPRPDFSKATVPQLIEDLSSANLTVRMKAANQLVERGGAEAVAALGKPEIFANPFQRLHGLWVLERLNALANPLLQKAARDWDARVRVHAMKVLAERKSWTASQRDLVLLGLKDADAFVQRGAADALAMHPDLDNLQPLLDLRHQVPEDDTHLLHVVRMALRNHLRNLKDWKVVFARDVIDGRVLADVCTGVPGAHAAAYLLAHLERVDQPAEVQARYIRHVARHAQGYIQSFVLDCVRDQGNGDLARALALFKAYHQGVQERGGTLSQTARAWGEELTKKLLASREDKDLTAGVELIGLLKTKKAAGLLETLATDQTVPESRRALALTALVSLDPPQQISLLGRIIADGSQSITYREKAVQLLGGINVAGAQDELMKGFAVAPDRLAKAIGAGMAATPAGRGKLLDAVALGKASPRLLQWRPIAGRAEWIQDPTLLARLVKLTQGLPPPEKGTQELLDRRRQGYAVAKADPQQGAKVFDKTCAVCHQLGNKGTKVGPQLDGVGIRGLDRLLEDILDPNRNVDQAFRLTTLALSNGQIINGLLLREEGQVLILADSQGKEVRVSKKDIEERNNSQLSLMPANMMDQVAEGDFYHLLAFLLNQQAGRK